MKIAIMQPYFMPYLGYWQLIQSVDRFIVLDNVNFIKQGYINRNFILSKGEKLPINILVKGISSNKLILEHELELNPIWKKKLLKTISQNYSKAEYYGDAMPIIEKCILHNNSNLSEYLSYQIRTICEYLNISTEILSSTEFIQSENLKGQARIIDICIQNNATTYINAVGGKDLYNVINFKDDGIDLKFINMKKILYNQFEKPFIENLSIIDIIMFNSVEKANRILKDYELE